MGAVNLFCIGVYFAAFAVVGKCCVDKFEKHTFVPIAAGYVAFCTVTLVCKVATMP